MAARSAALVLSALLAAGPHLSCAGARNPIRAAKEVDTGDERSVGAQVDAAIQAQVPVIDDPVVLGFVQDLGQRIVAGIEPQPFIYRFRVIEDPNLNAFALPGGYIYFHSATVLQAGTLDELAGVMGHEIAHVKARHYARGVEESFWPSLLTRLAGLAAAITTGEGGFLAAAEGVNVALQLKYTREFEAEADDLGAAFMARAGFDPAGMGLFFDRILAANRPADFYIPPYLYSHPELEDRIDAVHRRADTLELTGRADPRLEAAFRNAQARLAMLVAQGRTRWAATRPYDRAKTDPLLVRATAALDAGEPLDALEHLRTAQRLEPFDPRPPFRQGEILLEREWPEEAARAYARALALDPSVALAWYRLGTAHKALGNRHNAVYCFEQAERRFTEGGDYRARARLAIETLSDPPLREAGLLAGTLPRRGAPGESLTSFGPDDGAVVWWARVDRRFVPVARRIRVRWIDPRGAVVQDEFVEPASGRRVHSALALRGASAEGYGIWRVEARLEGQVLDKHTFHYAPPGPPSSSSR